MMNANDLCLYNTIYIVKAWNDETGHSSDCFAGREFVLIVFSYSLLQHTLSELMACIHQNKPIIKKGFVLIHLSSGKCAV